MPSFYDEVGGEDTFRQLVDHFYKGVAGDPLLRPLYPDPDLSAAADRLRLFLIQYWGGPDTYSRQRGHPRLRLRHLPFSIGHLEREAWMRHMAAAVESLELPPPASATLLDYFEMAATAMMNRL